jgi:hypothetical protein
MAASDWKRPVHRPPPVSEDAEPNRFCGLPRLGNRAGIPVHLKQPKGYNVPWKDNTLIIECPCCDARVDAKEIATYQCPTNEEFDEYRDRYRELGHPPECDEDPDVYVDAVYQTENYRATLLVCVACNNGLLAYQKSDGLRARNLPICVRSS